jgi:hypothetical protein
MGINAKNKPGCPCCQCTCPDGETLYPKANKIKIEISGLADSHSFVSYEAAIGGFYEYIGDVTGISDLNGTYFVDIDVTEENCIDDDIEPSPSQEVIGQVTVNYEKSTYATGDCNDPNRTPVGTITETHLVDVTLTVTKIGPSAFSILLASNEYIWIKAFSLLGCENDFNSAQKGSFTSYDYNLTTPSTSDIEQVKDGEDQEIWLAPFLLDTENDGNTVCDITFSGSDYLLAGSFKTYLYFGS